MKTKNIGRSHGFRFFSWALVKGARLERGSPVSVSGQLAYWILVGEEANSFPQLFSSFLPLGTDFHLRLQIAGAATLSRMSVISVATP